MKDFKVPFMDGKFINYPMSYHEYEWRDNFRFTETLQLVEINRGRSAANYTVKDSKGNRYTMFMKELFDICNNHKVVKGKIKGEFCFCKRGANYGIKLLNK